MIITVDLKSAVPPYEQLRAGISRLVATGELARNARLPTVRQLAADLGLAPGTVARAYRELESEGVVMSRGRHGTHVSGMPTPPPPSERQRRLTESALAFATATKELGIDRTTALAEVARVLSA
jgi:DNA-binding transcriptional regulator YhcF (GntR family)